MQRRHFSHVGHQIIYFLWVFNFVSLDYILNLVLINIYYYFFKGNFFLIFVQVVSPISDLDYSTYFNFGFMNNKQRYLSSNYLQD